MNELVSDGLNVVNENSILKRFIDRANELLVILMAISIPITTAGTSITSALLIALFCFSGEWSEKYQYLKTFPAAKASLLLFSLMLLGICYSHAPWHDIINRLGKYHKLLLIPVLIYVFKTHSLRLKALLVFIAVISLILLSYYLVYYLHLGVSDHLAAMSWIARGHIFFSMLFSFVFYCAVIYAIYDARYRLFYVALAAAASWYLLFICTGRTGLVTLFGVCCLLTCHLYYKNKKVFIMSLLFVVLSTVVISTTHNHLRAQFVRVKTSVSLYKSNNKDTSAGQRLQFYHTSWRIMRDQPGISHWLIGLGTGSFVEAYLNAYDKYAKSSHLNMATSNPHNQFLEILIQIGLVGVFALLLLYLSIWFYSGNELFLSRYLGQGLGVILVIDSCLNSTLMDHGTGMFYVFFIAMFAASKSKASVEHS